MIRIQTGEFKLDGYTLVIHPDLSLAEFNAGDITILQSDFNEISGYTNHFFEGKISGLDADFLIQFQYEHLHRLFFRDVSGKELRENYKKELKPALEKQGWADASVGHKWLELISEAEDLKKQRHDAWLQKIIGALPPYEYDWGCIASSVDRDGDASIGVIFKYEILDRQPGITDIKAYFQNRRKESNRMEDQIEALDVRRKK